MDQTANPPTLADFFCGCGGIGMAFQRNGFRIVGSWDFDKYACQTYAANIDPNVKCVDILAMDWTDVPKADVWAFGFPCQDISHAGLQAGLEGGKRSRMFFEVMRLLRETREADQKSLPAFLLAENVKGLKKYIEVLRAEYAKVGYRMEYTLLNSLEWGVPQHRERYYVVGIRDDVQVDFKFPEVVPNFPRPTFLEILEPVVSENHYKPASKAEEVVSKMSAEQNQKIRDSARAVGELWTMKTIATGVFGVKNGFLPQDYSNTLDASAYKGIGCNQTRPAVLEFDPLRLRKLTPREYARLQGFPDSFKLVCSDTQMYKQFGNSVSVPVVEAVARQIKLALEEING